MNNFIDSAGDRGLILGLGFPKPRRIAFSNLFGIGSAIDCHWVPSLPSMVLETAGRLCLLEGGAGEKSKKSRVGCDGDEPVEYKKKHSVNVMT